MNTTCDNCQATTNDGTNFCTRCRRHLREHLYNIRSNAHPARQLAYNLARHGNTGHTSGKPESRPPLNIELTTTLDELTGVITRWCNDISRIRNGRPWEPLTAPAAGEPISQAAAYLANQLTWMAHRPDVALFVEDIQHIDRTLTRITAGPAEQQYLGPCGHTDDTHISTINSDRIQTIRGRRCGGDVYAQRGSLSGNCRTCGQMYRVAERTAWLDGIVRDHLFTAAEIADAYHLNRNTITQWAARGRLTQRGRQTPRNGGPQRPTYRLGDVLDLAQQDAHRRTQDRNVITRNTGNCPMCNHPNNQHTTTIGGTTQCHAMNVTVNTTAGTVHTVDACACTLRPTAAQTHPRRGDHTPIDPSAINVPRGWHMEWRGMIDNAQAELIQRILSEGTGA